jgi:hypothetical protein
MHREGSNGTEVEAIDRFPESDLFFFVFCVLDASEVQRGVVRED